MTLQVSKTERSKHSSDNKRGLVASTKELYDCMATISQVEHSEGYKGKQTIMIVFCQEEKEQKFIQKPTT